MRNARIAVCHLGGKLGISRIDIAEVIPAYLRADPLAVRILVNCALGRLVPVYEIAVSDTLRGAAGVPADKRHPVPRNVV